jgi:hypothetical protein
MRVLTITLFIFLFVSICLASDLATSGDFYFLEGPKKGGYVFKEDNSQKEAFAFVLNNGNECKMLEKGSSPRGIVSVIVKDKDVSLVLMSGPSACTIKGKIIDDMKIQLELNNYKLKYQKIDDTQFWLTVPKELMMPPGLEKHKK